MTGITDAILWTALGFFVFGHISGWTLGFIAGRLHEIRKILDGK